MEDKTLKHRLVYSSLVLPIRLALLFKIPMKDLVDLLQMAAFHETKRRGLKMREVSELLDVSMRKVSLLSQRLRRNFADEEMEEELPRRIEFMLWAEPLSQARLIQVMRRDDAEDVLNAVEQLIEEGRVEVDHSQEQPIYRVVKHEFRLVSPEWTARLDGVNNLLSNIANALDARFFHEDERAFARTISFRVRDQDMDALKSMYRDVIWQTLSQLDEQAHDDPDAHVIDMSIVWAPYEFIFNTLEQQRSTTEQEDQ